MLTNWIAPGHWRRCIEAVYRTWRFLVGAFGKTPRTLSMARLLLISFVVSGSANAVDKIDGSAVDQKSGLRLQFSSSGIKKSGYRAIDLTITRSLMVNVDRRIAVNIRASDWNRNRVKSPQLRVVIDIPQGVRRVTERVLVPQSSKWSQIRLTAFEDGEQIRNLTVHHYRNRQNNEEFTETFPGWWFIDSEFEAVRAANEAAQQSTKLLPNVRAMLEFMPHYQQEFELLAGRDSTTVDAEILNDLPNLTTVNMTGFSELPTNWLEFTCYDIIVISMSDLQQMLELHPKKWSALKTFVRQGANLVIYATAPDAVDSNFANLNEISELLDGRSDSPFEWQLPNDDDFTMPLDSFLPNVVYSANNRLRARGVGRPNQSQYDDLSEDFANQDSMLAATPPSGNVPPAGFRIRPFGMGRVVAISSHKPFRILKDMRGHQQWAWIMKSLGTERVMWYQRHGLSNGRRNADFWNFLLEGVGAAPVLPFLFLITGFVVVIGPVNYFTLRKWDRLYLILFTVPVCAAIVTVGLLAYAFLADGIATRMRLRSFTLVDVDAGDAITWSRQSYYAGLPPSDGISFSENAAVYPVIYAPDEETDVERTLRWEDGKQVLARGYLRTRTLAQMMVCETRPANQTVDIVRTAEGVSATNGFGFDIEFLMAIDPTQQVAYRLEGIDAGETATMTQVSIADAKEITTKLIADNSLGIPPGVDFGYGPRGRYWNVIDTDSSPAHTSTSMLEKSIDEMQLFKLPQECVYYAVTSECHEFVPRGADASAEEDGFHVIKGYWKP